MQGLLQLAGIPYTGPGVLASALCMDKATSKIIFSANGIPQADWLVFTKNDAERPVEIIKKVEDNFAYPVFVKPSGAGSSIGAGIVKSQDMLDGCDRKCTFL